MCRRSSGFIGDKLSRFIELGSVNALAIQGFGIDYGRGNYRSSENMENASEVRNFAGGVFQIFISKAS